MASSSSASNADNCGTTKRIVEYFYEQDIGNYHFGPGHPMKVSPPQLPAACSAAPAVPAAAVTAAATPTSASSSHLRLSYSTAAAPPSRTACA